MTSLAVLLVGAQVASASLPARVPRMTASVVHVKSARQTTLSSLPLISAIAPTKLRQAVGSGVVIDPDGLILTNDHIVQKSAGLIVTIGGRDLPARVVGRDSTLDIALIRVDAGRKLRAAPLGRSSRLRVGDSVVAVGNPFGLDHTVTTGIVSARERLLAARPHTPLLQTDASINPGNSGGPLYDLTGRVIGLNTAMVLGAHGIGFAVPIDLVKRALPQLIARGRVERGFLGARLGEVSPELGRSMHLGRAHGVLVAGVLPNGPAARAGLLAGDVIVRWDGVPASSPRTMPSEIVLSPPGTRVRVELMRLGSPVSIEVEMGARPESSAIP